MCRKGHGLLEKGKLLETFPMKSIKNNRIVVYTITFVNYYNPNIDRLDDELSIYRIENSAGFQRMVEDYQ